MDREVTRAERARHQTATVGSLMDRETAKTDRASHQATTEAARQQTNLATKSLAAFRVSRAGKNRVETIETNHPMVSQSRTNRREITNHRNSQKRYRP